MADPGFWDWKIGDIATWFGGIASAMAAAAAVYAARKAWKIAELPIAQQEKERLITCRSIAPAIGPEFRRASEEALELADRLAQCSNVKHSHDLIEWLRHGFLLRTIMLERYVDKFDVFGSENGALLSAATAGILDLRATVAHWTGIDDRSRMHGLIVQFSDIARLRPVEAEAKMVADQIEVLGPILAEFGGGKTPYEV